MALSEDFATYLDESGTLGEFCEERDMETGACETKVMDMVAEDDVDDPDPEPPEMPQEMMEEPSTEEEPIETIVDDCFGESVFGLSRPNEHACKRAFERQEHRIARLEAQVQDAS